MTDYLGEPTSAQPAGPPAPNGFADPYRQPPTTPSSQQLPAPAWSQQPQQPAWSQPQAPNAPAPAWSAQQQQQPPQWTPYAQPYGSAPGSYPDQEPRKTNPWAIVALVTGIVAIFPVALGAGITALVQIRRRPQAGAGMAIGGIVAGSVWMLIGIVVAALGAFSSSLGAFSSSGDYPYLGRVANAGSTTVGSCLLEPSSDDSTAAEIDCAKGHYAEVYLVGAPSTEATWPGADKLGQHADDLCYDAFAAYVGTDYDSSEYDYDFFLPDRAEWTAGEHRAVCVVVPGDSHTMRGSVRHSGR